MVPHSQQHAALLRRLLCASLKRRAASAVGQGEARNAAPFSSSSAAAAAAASASGLPADALARIKELRERTGAPLADVKASLASCEWDMDKAVDALRARGLKAAAKKSARRAAEGLVAVAVGDGASPSTAAIVEINSETDFVARNPDFQALVLQAARGVLARALQEEAKQSGGFAAAELSAAQAAAAPMPGGSSSAGPTTVGDAVSALAAKVRENLVLRRAFVARVPPGSLLGAYVHAPAAEGAGRIAALAAVELPPTPSTSSDSSASDIARQVAMHVAGMNPLYSDVKGVPAQILDAERTRLAEELARDAASARKPEAVRAKVVEGRLGKWLDGCVLSRQAFVLDDGLSVEQAVSKAAGKGARVAGLLRVQLGEGAAEEDGAAGGGGDFADEVAKLAGGK